MIDALFIKRRCFFLWFLILTPFIDAQHKLDSLLSERQYLTAYEYLYKLDPNNKQPDVVIEKVNIAIDYYSDSQYYKTFSFLNLRPEEDLQELRNANQGGTLAYDFQVDSVLLGLIEDYPDDYRLSKSLAYYYYKVYIDFGDSWGESSEDLLKKSYNYYMAAYKHGVYDYFGLYVLGYYHTIFQNYFEAQNWYLKSLRENPDEPLTNYNLAVTYLFDGLPQKGIEFGASAYELYVDSLKKSDAARITGILYMKSGDDNNALDYFIKANELSPGYRPNQMYLLKTYLSHDNYNEAKELAYDIITDDLYNPEIPDEFNELFIQSEKENWLHVIYDKILSDYHSDSEACGNISFHYAKLLFKEGHKVKAKNMLRQSKKHFHKIFGDDHQVFEAIEQMMAHM